MWDIVENSKLTLFFWSPKNSISFEVTYQQALNSSNIGAICWTFDKIFILKIWGMLINT